jgi:hypothetical protein
VNSTFLEKAQGKLEIITRKWWLYLSLLLPILAGTYSSKDYDVRQSMDVIMDSLANPFIYRFPILFPIAKIVPIILIGGLMILGNRLRRAFNIYILQFCFLRLEFFRILP